MVIVELSKVFEPKNVEVILKLNVFDVLIELVYTSVQGWVQSTAKYTAPGLELAPSVTSMMSFDRWMQVGIEEVGFKKLNTRTSPDSIVL